MSDSERIEAAARAICKARIHPGLSPNPMPPCQSCARLAGHALAAADGIPQNTKPNHAPDMPFGCTSTWGERRLHVCNREVVHEGAHQCKCGSVLADAIPQDSENDALRDRIEELTMELARLRDGIPQDTAGVWSVKEFRDESWLYWHGDGMAASHLAELLSGEDEGRIPVDDVRALLRALVSGETN